MKIAIIGAGISGCSAYLMLRKHLPKPLSADPHSITVYDAYDTEADTPAPAPGQGETHSSTLVVGGGLGVGPNGLNVLKRLDEELLCDIVRGGYVVDTSMLKTKNGTVLARLRAAASSSSSGDGRMCMVATSRHSLWRCLRSRVPHDAVVTKRVEAVTANPNGRNLISFVDGSQPAEADLVLGAEGLKSVTGRALFPEANQDPFPARYE